MPIQKLRIMPGVDLQSTPTLNQTNFAQSQLIRFYKGLPQKMGGWAHFSSSAVIGTCRALLGWADLLGNSYLATGTEQRLQVYVGGSPIDITPIIATTNPAVSFSTSVNSATVTIADTQVPSAGDWINLITQVAVGGLVLSGFYRVVTVGSGTYTVTAASKATSAATNSGAVPAFATTNSSASVRVTLANHGLTATASSFNVPLSVSVGGITLSGTYIVASVIDANDFTISAGTVATSTASASLNGGDAQIAYLLQSGNATSFYQSGFGQGNWGAGNWGLANTTSNAIAPMRIWSLDHFGQDLVAAPLGGTIYYWQPGTATPAQRVSSTSPLYCNWILVASEVEILIALGAESGGTQYPNLVKWCDATDFTDWTPTVSNQAGSFQLNSGSKLLFGVANGLTIYLWTDLGVWSMSYVAQPYIFSFNELATECGAISSRAVAISASGAMWLSAQGFFQLSSSGVVPVVCPVWDFYFNNVDTTQLQAITSGTITAFHEAMWFFPMIGGGMGYLKYNFAENVWDVGTLIRTAWIDLSPAGNPMGVDGNGLVQQHEVSPDADGQAMQPSATTHYFDAQDGEDFIFCDMIIPDFNTTSTGNGATIGLTVLAQDYPEGPVRTDGPKTMQFGSAPNLPSNFTTCNIRGRQIALEISSSDLGSFWRLGAVRYNFEPDGKL